MTASPPPKLVPGRSVLVLADVARARDKRALPTPVLYLGMATQSGQPPPGITSDTFKRRLLDSQGREHLVSDATVCDLYRAAAPDEEQRLTAEYWAKVAGR